MKSTDIHAGAELWYSASAKWRDRPYTGEWALVVGDERYVNVRSGSYPSYVAEKGGDLVAVRFGGPTGHVRYVRKTTLRGPYAETKAAVERAYEADMKEREAKSRKESAAWVAAELVRERAGKAGLKVRLDADYLRRPVIAVAVEDMATFLDALDVPAAPPKPARRANNVCPCGEPGKHEHFAGEYDDGKF